MVKIIIVATSALFLLCGLAATTQAQAIPKVFIALESASETTRWYPFVGTLASTKNDLPPLSQIAKQFQDEAVALGAPLAVVFEKDKADYVWLLGRQTNGFYTWMIIDNVTATMVTTGGSERVLANCVKDVSYCMLMIKQVKEAAALDEVSLTGKYPPGVTIGTNGFVEKKIHKGMNHLQVSFPQTVARVSIKISSIDPTSVTFLGGALSAKATSSGGYRNFVDLTFMGVGKKDRAGPAPFDIKVVSLTLWAEVKK